MLARILGMLYIKNNIEHQQIQERCTRQLPWNALIFLLFFLPFLIRLLVKDGFSTSSSSITIESMKYLHNLLEMPILPVILLIGIVLVLFGIYKSSRSVQYRKGIWFTGIGTVLTVLVLLLIAAGTTPPTIRRTSTFRVRSPSPTAAAASSRSAPWR